MDGKKEDGGGRGNGEKSVKFHSNGGSHGRGKVAQGDIRCRRVTMVKENEMQLLRKRRAWERLGLKSRTKTFEKGGKRDGGK